MSSFLVQTTSLHSQFIRELQDQEFKRKSTLCRAICKIPMEYEIIRKDLLKDVSNALIGALTGRRRKKKKKDGIEIYLT